MNISKDDYKSLIVVFVLGGILILGLFILSNKLDSKNKLENNINKSNIIDNELSLVDDYNTFFGVSGDVNNFIVLFNGNNANSIYSLLKNEYIQNNNIDLNNLYDKISLSTSIGYFVARSMYVKKFNNNSLFYVVGELYYQDDVDDDVYNLINDDYKILVFRDYNNFTLAFYPLKDSDDLSIISSFKDINIEKNTYNNKFSGSKKSTDDICVLYLSDFLRMLSSDINKSYLMLSSSFKDSKYSKIEDYKEYINNNISKFSTSIKSCKMSNGSYIVYDNNENYYSFKEKSIMNYEVTFLLAN